MNGWVAKPIEARALYEAIDRTLSGVEDEAEAAA